MTIVPEIRRAARVLRRSPGFATLVVLTLAVGLGANVAIFGVVRSVLLAGLPFGDPDRIVMIRGTNPDAGIFESGVSLHDFEDWRAESGAFLAWNGQQATRGGRREAGMAGDTAPFGAAGGLRG